MNQSLQAHRQWQLPSVHKTHSIKNVLAATFAVTMIGALSACSSVPDLAKERVAQSETSVQQAQQTLGKSEHGAVELQQARDKLNAAKSALSKGQGKEAERSAAQAHLYAELAVAKSQSADARKAANEVLASLEMLRQETERTTPTQR
jgi:hypothetical protein